MCARKSFRFNPGVKKRQSAALCNLSLNRQSASNCNGFHSHHFPNLYFFSLLLKDLPLSHPTLLLFLFLLFYCTSSSSSFSSSSSVRQSNSSSHQPSSRGISSEGQRRDLRSCWSCCHVINIVSIQNVLFVTPDHLEILSRFRFLCARDSKDTCFLEKKKKKKETDCSGGSQA